MAFVKLDVGILNSTLWFDKDAREVFITALLMATPSEFKEPVRQIAVRNLEDTGFEAPAGWYGFVAAAGTGIVHRCMIDEERGIAALERLGSPEPHSRTSAFEGRRLIRIDGGYLVLNYMLYRDKDHTAAVRSKRYREKLASRRDEANNTRSVTHAEAEANAEASNTPVKSRARNPLIDALADIEGIPLAEIGAAAPRLATAVRDIRMSTIDVTPAEIRRRAANYKTQFNDAILTATALAKHWGRCHVAGIANASTKPARNNFKTDDYSNLPT